MKPFVRVTPLAVAVFAFLHAVSAFALELALWNPGPGYPSIVLPVREGETREQARARYWASVDASSELSELGRGVARPPLGSLAPWSAPAGTDPLFAVLANEFEDLARAPQGERMVQVLEVLNVHGAKTVVIPIAADLGLSESEAGEFREKVLRESDAVLALGGEDVDPSHYGRARTYSRGTRKLRDAAEIAWIRSTFDSRRSVFYGICRGHQICSVARGGTLVQDLDRDLGIGRGHDQGWHRIRLEEGTTLRALFGREEIVVNTLHHQAVETLPEDARMAARSTDRRTVVEAIEFLGGLGFTYQFHPELMQEKEEGRKILQFMVRYARKVKEARNRAGSAPLSKSCLGSALESVLRSLKAPHP